MLTMQTYNNHWFWEGDELIIRSAAIEAVLNLDKVVEFEFEFYPRVPGNSVTYTLDPNPEEC